MDFPGFAQVFDEGGRVHPSTPRAPGEELRELARAEGIPWIDDPTNDNVRFTRVKARKALAALAPLGITAERLAEVAGNLAAVQARWRAGGERQRGGWQQRRGDCAFTRVCGASRGKFSGNW